MLIAVGLPSLFMKDVLSQVNSTTMVYTQILIPGDLGELPLRSGMASFIAARQQTELHNGYCTDD